MKQRLDALKQTFSFRQNFVKKEINRGHFAEAVVRYHNYTLNPLVELLGIIYRPYRYDFMLLKYFNRDFPSEVVARIEPLYCVVDLADLAEKQQIAEVMFAETIPLAQEMLQLQN